MLEFYSFKIIYIDVQHMKMSFMLPEGIVSQQCSLLLPPKVALKLPLGIPEARGICPAVLIMTDAPLASLQHKETCQVHREV